MCKMSIQLAQNRGAECLRCTLSCMVPEHTDDCKEQPLRQTPHPPVQPMLSIKPSRDSSEGKATRFSSPLASWPPRAWSTPSPCPALHLHHNPAPATLPNTWQEVEAVILLARSGERAMEGADTGLPSCPLHTEIACTTSAKKGKKRKGSGTKALSGTQRCYLDSG